MSYRPSHHRPGRSGFTLIEILVVIGIILILIGMFFVGMHVIGRHTKGSAAKVNLQNLQGMLSELETTGSLRSRQPVQMWVKGALYPPTPGDPSKPINIWADARPDTTPPNPPDAGGKNEPIGDVDTPMTLGPGDVTIEQWDGSQSGDALTTHKRDRFQSAAVCNTQLVMQLLLQVPNNRRAIEKLGADSLLKNPEQGKSTVSHAIAGTGAGSGPFLLLTGNNPANVPNGAISPPVPVDPWGNPVILVPSAGIRVDEPWDGMETYKKGRIVSSSGKLYRALKSNLNTTTTATGTWEQIPSQPPSASPPQYLITSPDHRPFFCSAGDDGDFRTPDDNVYSFE